MGSLQVIPLKSSFQESSSFRKVYGLFMELFAEHEYICLIISLKAEYRILVRDSLEIIVSTPLPGRIVQTRKLRPRKVKSSPT